MKNQHNQSSRTTLKQSRAKKITNLVYIHTAEKVKVGSNNALYTDGSYSQAVWRRYHQLAKNIVFIARKDANQYSNSILEKRYHRIDSRVTVVFVEDILESIVSYADARKRIRNILLIRDEVRKGDLLMIRMVCHEGITAAITALFYKKPYLVECVGCAWDSLWNHGIFGKIMAPFQYLAMRYVVRKSSAALFVTKYYLQRRYPTRSVSIGCSDVQLSSRKLVKRNFREKKDVILGTLAPLDVDYKGQDNIISVLSRLNSSAESKSYTYQLVGGGSNQRLRQLAIAHGVEQYVEFKGQLSHAEVFSWLDTIDIYVQPSKVEGLPRALIEAMSRGCPCLGSNLGGIPELLEEDYTFDWKNKQSIIAAVLRISNANSMRKASYNNMRKASEYMPNELESRRGAFYREVITNIMKGRKYDDK